MEATLASFNGGDETGGRYFEKYAIFMNVPLVNST
jgi:hypothetical protein